MHERIAPEAQMVFCRRRPAEKSTARQYQDRAWKPSTCDGNGNGGVLSSSLILKAPRPAGVRRRAGTCHLHRVRGGNGADDQPTTRLFAAWFGAVPAVTQQLKESPRGWQ